MSSGFRSFFVSMARFFGTGYNGPVKPESKAPQSDLNLVFILADQLRPDFLGCYGADFVETPHIDALAARGVRYTSARSTSPICVPARATLLTGLNAIRNGVTGNSHWLRPDLSDCGVETWPEIIGRAGYRTAAVGKMHFYPWDSHMGFGYRVSAEDKRWINVRDDYWRFLRENGYRKYHGSECDGYHENKGAVVSPLPWEYTVDHFVGSKSCEYIRTYGNNGPFALMVGFPGPHCPYDPAPEFLRDIDPERMPPPIPDAGDTQMLRRQNIEGNRGAWNGVDYAEFNDAQKRKVRAHYAALVRQIDHEVGRIVEALREEGLLERTAIVFSSDHGDYLGDHGLVGKGHFYESSIRVPLVVSLPDETAGRTHEGLVELGDVTATLLSLAGCPVPGYADSIPLPDLGLDTPGRSTIVGTTSGGWMIHDGRWKLCSYATGETHLFDLDEDPTEQRNLAGDPAHHDRLLRMYDALVREIMRSVAQSHADKVVDPGNSLWSSEEYGYEGRVRRYPTKIAGGSTVGRGTWS